MRPLNPHLRSVLRFLCRTVSIAMGCFFACFRIKNDDCLPRSRGVRSKNHPELVVSQNPLSSLFQYEETEDHKYEEQGNGSLKSPSTMNKELREEAKFLKACGTLNETPYEIRKAARKLKASPPEDADLDRSKFHSWLPDEAIQKLQPGKPSDLPPTPLKLTEMLGGDLNSQEHSPSSCISDVENTRTSSISSTMASGEVSVDMPPKYQNKVSDNCRTPLSPPRSVTDARQKSKSVRFECEIDMFSSENDNHNLKICETPVYQIASKNAPHPTPLKLSGDMQTPGTVFPASVENLTNGRARIRSQYAYPVLNPVQNVLQWKALKEDQFTSNQSSDKLRDTPEQENPQAKQERHFKKASGGEGLNVEASLSSWLKQPAFQKDERRIQLYRTPGDRPIVGLVATHWHDDEWADNFPRGWDGNGIPNSTNKYKEDQKVRWHATPFEERLEKALSEESFVPQRKNLNGTPIAFDENEECDTALSQLQPSVPPVAKSMASC